MTSNPENIDLNNADFQNLWNMVERTHRSVFLTGKAGTGKSPFLRYICAHTKQKYVVLAPTGIAAVNVNGQTLHSFFKLPFKPLLPDDPDFAFSRLKKTLKYKRDKVKLIRNLDLIIIDEISMVRADMIDFIDRVLRFYSGNNREPFGGKQLLFVGDIFQLEPVVTRDMREILRRYYKQFFFFNAHVFSSLGLIPIELRKIYRQNSSEFISMLDRIRVNHATTADLRLLNSLVEDISEKTDDEFVVTLATRRDTVDAINDEHMEALESEEFVFNGEISGTYPDNDLPTQKDLSLKVGAQVIFIKNDYDGRWVNGSLGIVTHLDENEVKVTLEDGNEYDVEKESWQNILYSYDDKEKKVVEDVQGVFTQYPVKPAWALTVHKSQGLTFNRTIIDFSGGAFSSGQTYVALSRCTSLEGITLLKPLSERDIIVNSAVVEFSKRFNDQQQISNAMREAEALKLFKNASDAFRRRDFRTCVNEFIRAEQIIHVTEKESVKRLIATKLCELSGKEKEIELLKQTILEQKRQLRGLAMEYVAMGDESMGYGTLAEEPATRYKGSRRKIDEISLKAGLANYDKALRIYPECVEAMLGKARLLKEVGETDKAENLLKDALKLGLGKYDILMELAGLYEEEKDTAGALKMLKRAIKSDKTLYEPHMKLADIYERIGLDDLSEEHRATAEKLRLKEERKKKK